MANPTSASVATLAHPDPRPQSVVLSARKRRAHAGGGARVWHDAAPLASAGPSLSRSPLNLSRTTVSTGKDENERGFLPYL